MDGQPFEGVKDLLFFPILGFIDNLGLSRQVSHPLLGKGSSDNVPGKVFHSLFITGLDPRPAENIKSRMAPFIQQRDHILCDLALFQKHLEHLVSEYLLQSFGVNGRRNGKHIVFMKGAVGNKDM